jgi:hypothetical protein
VEERRTVMKFANNEDAKGEANHVLRHLGAAMPPEGLEERVMARVRNAQHEPLPNLAGTWPAWSLSWTVAVGMALVAVAGAAYSVLHFENKTQQQATVRVAPALSSPPMQRREGQSSQHEQHEEVSLVHPGEVVITLPPSTRKAVRQVHRTEPASYPAPPAPITEQERLAATFVRSGEVQRNPQLASLVRSEVLPRDHGLPTSNFNAPGDTE